jgi:hypothetical protein
MWGDIMRGFYSLGVLFLLAPLGSVSAVEEVSERENRLFQLSELRTQFYRFLDRVENGQSPCHLPSCQLEKYQIMEKVSHQLGFLPKAASPLLDEAHKGVFAGYRLANLPAPYLNSETDSHQSRLRYQYSLHPEWRGSWYGFLSDLYLIRTMIKSFRQVLEDPIASEQLRQYMDAGLLEMAFHLSEGRAWADQIVRSRHEGNLEQESVAEEKANLHFAEYHRLRENVFPQLQAEGFRLFEGDVTLFPGLNPAQSLQMMLHLRSWISDRPNSYVFEALHLRFLDRLERTLESVVKLSHQFNDLEFGVLGLRNMESFANPVLRNEKDLTIDQQIQKRESLEEGLYTSADFFLGFLTINAWLGPSMIRVAPMVGLYEFHKLNSQPLQRTEGSRSIRLRFESIQFQEQVETRTETLMETKQVILQRIQQIESEIAQLEARNR